MAIRDLNNWLEKHEWEISEEKSTTLGYLSRDDVLTASDEATAERDKREKAEEFLQEKEEEIKKLLLDSIYTEEDNSQEINDILSGFDNWFYENRTADDYYPIWLKAWVFPSRYTAEELNCFDISGLVFFEIQGFTFVSLTTCGMNMTPSLEYAYFMFSDLDVSKNYIKQRIFRQPSYFSYVIGREDFKKLCGKLGITERKIQLAEKRVSQRLNKFKESLNNLSKLRDEGKITQTEAGLLGLMTYFKHEGKEKNEVKELAG